MPDKEQTASSAKESLSLLEKRTERKLRKLVEEAVFATVGEVTSRARTAEVGKTYLDLKDPEKHIFFDLLINEFDVFPDQLAKALQRIEAAADDAERVSAELNLREELEAPRVKLLKQLNTLNIGYKLLINMREDLFRLVPSSPARKKLDEDLRAILNTWFDIGLLDLQEITWNSPAALLEKLINYEAVHEIQSWKDMKHRLEIAGRCYGYFHNRMPDEPLIFVEVALVNGLPPSIQRLLDEEEKPTKPEDANTAIFYSISSTQGGLRGIKLGNFLIKRVVNHLKQELPGLKHFATLSPIPGFCKWLEESPMAGPAALTTKEAMKIKALAGGQDAREALLSLLKSDWASYEEARELLKVPLMRMCAYYLLHEKRNGHARNSVAHFHLTNGARLERINWMGDISDRGMEQSAGMMVNYYYKLADVPPNHERYVTEGKIAASREVRSWLKKGR